jgi:cyclase
MLRTRIIPTLLLSDNALVKTVKFKNPVYIGDPINTVRIFNEMEVDELVFLDINASKQSRKPNFQLLEEIANECFMPLAYGGGVNDFEIACEIFAIGFEKIILNTSCHLNVQLINKLAKHFGNQAIVASVDVKKSFWGKYEVYASCGTVNTKKNPVDFCNQMVEMGVGEILLTSIDKEGTWLGFDVELTRQISDNVTVPVIAHGGAGNINHIAKVVDEGRASAVALGSMVLFQQKGMGVLVNYPDKKKLKFLLNEE